MTTSNIATAINAAHDRVEHAEREGARHAAEAGRLLTQAKTTVPHGGWAAWVSANCRFSLRTAQVYMRVAEYLADGDPAKTQRVALLGLREIDRELAAAGPKPATTRGKGFIFTPEEKEAAAIRAADQINRWCADDAGFAEIRRLLRDAGAADLAGILAARRGIPDEMTVDRKPFVLSREAQAEVDRLMGSRHRPAPSSASIRA